MDQRVSELFFKAISRRGVTMKAAARLGGCSPLALERVNSGETRKLDIEIVYRVARSLPDMDEFLAEIMPGLRPGSPAHELLELSARVLEIRDIIQNGPRAAGALAPAWCLDDGTAIIAPDGLAAAARQLSGTSFDDAGDIVDYVCRGFGWIGVGADGQIGAVRYDRNYVDPRACMGAIEALGKSPFERFVVCDAPGESCIVSKADVVRMLERRIRASRRTPAGWIDLELPISDAPARLRGVVERSDNAENLDAAILALLRQGQSSLYSVAQGEAFCIHIGSRFNAPTRNDVGMRVLDRPNHVHYAAMIDRHVVDAATRDQPVVSRIGVEFGSRKVIYERLALPVRIDGQALVLTTSNVISDNENAPPAVQGRPH